MQSKDKTFQNPRKIPKMCIRDSYRTKGVCSQMIHFDIEDNKVKNLSLIHI